MTEQAELIPMNCGDFRGGEDLKHSINILTEVIKNVQKAADGLYELNLFNYFDSYAQGYLSKLQELKRLYKEEQLAKGEVISMSFSEAIDKLNENKKPRDEE